MSNKADKNLALVGRVRHALEFLFSSVNQADAGRRLGVARALISRTLSGARLPSKTLVKALANRPEIDERWLLEGVGESPLRNDPEIRRYSLVGRSHWDNYEDFPVSEWRLEAMEDNTRLGYLEWVDHQRESAEEGKDE